MSRITLRCSNELKESFREHVETEGKSMSEALKEHMRDVTDHSTTGKLPDEEHLADAYETLYWTADGHPVKLDDAETAISNALNMPKHAVRSRVVKPLRNRGYLNLLQGTHAVRLRPNVDLQSDVLDSDPAGEEEATA